MTFTRASRTRWRGRSCYSRRRSRQSARTLSANVEPPRICVARHRCALGSRHECQPWMRSAVSRRYRAPVLQGQDWDSRRFVYQPVKFGWRGDDLYVEVHDDLYAMYPGLWKHAVNEVNRLGLEDQVDMAKLEKAVELRSGIPTYVMPGTEPGSGLENANLTAPSPSLVTPPATEPLTPALPATTRNGHNSCQHHCDQFRVIGQRPLTAR